MLDTYYSICTTYYSNDKNKAWVHGTEVFPYYVQDFDTIPCKEAGKAG